MGWIGDIGNAPDIDRWSPMTDARRAGAAILGSLMIGGDSPRDPNGLPFQLAVLWDADDQVIGLVTDDGGNPLAYVISATGTGDVTDESGRDALRPVPAEIAQAAWQWLDNQRDRG